MHCSLPSRQEPLALQFMLRSNSFVIGFLPCAGVHARGLQYLRHPCWQGDNHVNLASDVQHVTGQLCSSMNLTMKCTIC